MGHTHESAYHMTASSIMKIVKANMITHSVERWYWVKFLITMLISLNLGYIKENRAYNGSNHGVVVWFS